MSIVQNILMGLGGLFVVLILLALGTMAYDALKKYLEDTYAFRRDSQARSENYELKREVERLQKERDALVEETEALRERYR